MSELGSGLSLDEQWDLYVDESSGDLAFDEAGEEVRKDLAFLVGRFLTKQVGVVLNDGIRADIRTSARKIILADDRVEEINEISVVNSGEQPDELAVDVTLTVVTGETISDVFTPT